jgi:hypothetical protein
LPNPNSARAALAPSGKEGLQKKFMRGFITVGKAPLFMFWHTHQTFFVRRAFFQNV